MNRYLGLQEQIGGQLPIRFSDEVAAALLTGQSKLGASSGGSSGEAAAVIGNPFATVSRVPAPVTVVRKPKGSKSNNNNNNANNISHHTNVNFAKVVALESTIISHGMPYPDNVRCAKEVESIVREAGAIPATIAILDGVIHVGLSDAQLDLLGRLGRSCAKVSRRDLPLILSQKRNGATTVSGTILIAKMVGIDIMATGGVGGVHRGAEETMDISADLTELGRTRVLVVCAGVKSILDIGKTLEVLETQGVSVIGYQTEEFPSFYTRRSGFKAPLTLHSASQVANFVIASRRLKYLSGGLLACPIPEKDEAKSVDAAIQQSLQEVKEKKIEGRDVTPYVLQRVCELTKGDSLRANIALVKNNARVAAQVANAYYSLLSDMS